MTILVSFILFILFVVSYSRYKRIYCPIVFLNLLFAIILLFGSFGWCNLKTGNEDAALIVLLGVLFFNVGFYAYNPQNTSPKGYAIKRTDYEINSKLLYVLIAVLIGFTIAFASIAGALLASGQSLNTIRAVYFSAETAEAVTGEMKNPIIEYGTVYLYTPIQYLLIALSCIIIVDKDVLSNKPILRKIVIITTLANIATSMMTNGGRMILFNFIVAFASAWLLKNRRFSFKFLNNKTNLLFIFVLVALVSVANYVTQERSETEGSDNALRSLYVYFCGCIPNLQLCLNRLPEDNYTYGFVLISSFVRPIFTGINFIFHTGVPDIFATIDENLFFANTSNDIGGGREYNAFVTMFFFFYRDMGYIGVVLDSCILGAVFSYLYRRCTYNYRSLVIFLLAMQGLSIAFIRLQTLSVAYALAFIYAVFLIRRKKKPRLIRE